MTKAVKEAVVLCGGQAWMLKPDAEIPKPLLNFGDETLLEKQVSWLAKNGFTRVILALNKDLLGYLILKTDVYRKIKCLKTPEVTMSVEDSKLGTGGAIKKACQLVKNEIFYACNVDNLAFDSAPDKLLDEAATGIVMLLAKPTLSYGKVMVDGGYVKNFEEKPKLTFYVNAGHYAMTKTLVSKLFPDVGNFEKTVLPALAKRKALKGIEYHGTWINIDTFNDYLSALSLVQ
ncbi:MAG: NDP-sugar synthase [Candidatus Bathyarchaeota archaeon]|nr:MAG: NDP-sugar synthase [Candidatus Bathyarchaeota archaeon]